MATLEAPRCQAAEARTQVPFLVPSRIEAMAQYHFVYFDLRGRGEYSRVLFALSGAPYTEERIVYPDNWPALKTSKLMTIAVSMYNSNLFVIERFSSDCEIKTSY